MCRDPAPVGPVDKCWWVQMGVTLIQTDIAPDGWLEDDPASFWGPRPIFGGELLVSGSVAMVICVVLPI